MSAKGLVTRHHRAEPKGGWGDTPALSVPPFKAYRSKRFGPTTRNDIQIPRALGEANGHFAIVLSQGIVGACFEFAWIGAVRVCRRGGGMHGFVIDPLRCTRSGATELVDADPSQGFVRIPRVGIRPIVQLIVDPGQKCNGGVLEGVGEGLRSGRLFDIVSCSPTLVSNTPGTMFGVLRN